jgi:hypothetical protein
MQVISTENLALANGGFWGSLISTGVNTWTGQLKTEGINESRMTADYAREQRQEVAHVADVMRRSLAQETWSKGR